MFYKQKILPWLAACLVPIFYLLFYTPYGMDTTDFGYFYGYAWRILNGQMPYRDFAYIKPAFPLYWHAFWMWLTPENIQVLAGKAGFAMIMLTTAWVGSLYLNKLFLLHNLSLPLPLLATGAFVFGVHSFPHMPWHTADGVLFCSLALWSGISGWPVLSAITASCAMLCKQSFLLVPMGCLIMIWLCRNRKMECLYFLIAWLITMGLAYYWIYANGAWKDFRAMTTGQLDIKEALEAGLFIYLWQNWIIPLLAVAPWLICKIMKKKVLAYPCYCYLAILCGWYIWDVFTQKTWIGYGVSWPTLFMLLGAMCIFLPRHFLEPWFKLKELPFSYLPACAGLGAALLVAWSAAVSGGYKSPAFFAVPLVFSFYIVHAFLGGNVQKLAWATLFCGLIMFGAGYMYPYIFPVRPLMRSELKYDAGNVYPKAAGVKVDADMLARLTELKELRSKYGPAYKTLPGFSHAYYLNGDYPLYGSDWLIDWEINGEIEKRYKELLDKNITVFMEKDQQDTKQADKYARSGYSVPQLVRKYWKIVEETPHFVVFQPPAF